MVGYSSYYFHPTDASQKDTLYIGVVTKDIAFKYERATK
jgi:hypothetical protein